MTFFDHVRSIPLPSRIFMIHEPTCLLVDDDVIYLSFLAEIFHDRGYRVLTASTGEVALQHANRCTPVFILLDVAMPGLDGLQVLRTLRQHNATRSTLVVMLSGHDGSTDIFSALHEGADDYIVKPIRPNDLVDRIDALLQPDG